jgi:nitrogen-specific signal transduction histidine kinase
MPSPGAAQSAVECDQIHRPGRVTLRVRFSPPERLRFEMNDTGIGLREGQLERIFETFVQVADPSRRAGGTGPGLAISSRIVERMRGELRARSQFGKGSTFWPELQAPVVEQQSAIAASAPATGYMGPPRNRPRGQGSCQYWLGVPR